MEKIIQDALVKEAELKEVIASVKESVRTEMEKAVMPGVKGLKPDGRYFAVSLRTVSQQPGMNLSADYFSPIEQARIVNQRLENAKTMSDVIARIRDMVEKGSVRLGGTQYQLNPATREALQKYIEKE